ncbi:MAG TPA: cytotoxic necrotizing factor Rho-activating domain-containing protein, partial [Paraburkholderia sp.]
EEPAGSPAGKGTSPEVKYLGGVKIKDDYSLKDVIGTTAKALKSPFASFVSSARDLVKKAVEGKALTEDEEEKIYQYAGIVDTFASLTKQGGVTRLAGAVLESVNTLVDGHTVDPERLASDLTGAYKIVDHKLGPGKGAGGKSGKNPDTDTSAPPFRQLAAAVNDTKPVSEPAYQSAFDFPRFRIPFPVRAANSTEPRVIHKPSFNPPTRLPDGRVGYPLSPTKPPRLLDGKTTEPVAGTSHTSTEPVAGTSETSPKAVAGASETSTKAVAGTSETSTEPVSGTSGATSVATGGARSPAPARADASSRDPGGRATPRMLSRIGPGDLKLIAGKGPISLEVPANSDQDHLRVSRFRTPFVFYRRDKEVAMKVPLRLRKTDYEERRDVLLVGSGDDVTSYVANAKINAGKFWGGGGVAGRLEGAEVIELGNGRQGVGAIRLPFSRMQPGATVVVSGGAMNGCTMLFASDGRSLYACHAGSAEMTPGDWQTSEQGARSIAEAYTKMGPKGQPEYEWLGKPDDLVAVGKQYPFSALIYSGLPLGRTNALVGAGAVLGAVGGPVETAPNSNLNIPRHAYGPREGPRWHMMAFNYYESNPNLRTVGTAEAVVSKGLSGAVTVSVLAEKGTLDRGSSIGERGGPISYKYKPVDSESATYFVPKAS